MYACRTELHVCFTRLALTIVSFLVYTPKWASSAMLALLLYLTFTVL